MEHHPDTGRRRRIQRVQTELNVVIALGDGRKLPARVMDVSLGGMHLKSATVPEYGTAVTVVGQLQKEEWALLPATVRWFTSAGFGIEFEALTDEQAARLAAFLELTAA